MRQKETTEKVCSRWWEIQGEKGFCNSHGLSIIRHRKMTSAIWREKIATEEKKEEFQEIEWEKVTKGK